MKKLLLSTLILGAVVLSGCSLIKPQITETTPVEQDLGVVKDHLNNISGDIKAIRQALEKGDADKGVGSTEIKTSGVQTVNDKYGFSVNLPEKAVLAEKVLAVDGWGLAAFYYSDEKNSDVFTIGVHTYGQWNKIQSQEGIKPAKLGESEKYVYSVSYSQTVPSAYTKPVVDSFLVIK